MSGKVFSIRNIHDHSLYWCTWWGWVEEESPIGLFSEDEKEKLNLPIDGEWVEV